MKTRAEIITRALRMLRVVSRDEAAQPEDEATASEALDVLAGELPSTHGIFLDGVDEVDESVFIPLARVLAAEIAAEFSTTAPVSRATALVRLRAVTNPNDYTGQEEIADTGYY